MKKISVIFYILLLLGFLYFELGQGLYQDDRTDYDGVCENYGNGWNRVLPDGQRVTAEIPGKCEAERNEKIIIEKVLDVSDAEGKYICIRSIRQDIEVYLGDELRKEYSTKEVRQFGKTSAPAFVFVPLRDSDTGKTIRVVMQTDSSYSGSFGNIYYGDREVIWKFFFDEYGIEVILGLIMFLLGIFTAVISIALGVSNNRQFELGYLGFGIALAAVWLITNSMLRDIIIANVTVASNIAFMAIMLLPLPFLLYTNYIQKNRYKKAYIAVSIAVVIDFVMCTVLQVADIKDFADTIVIMAVMFVIAIALIIGTIMADTVRGLVREYRMVAIGVAGAAVMAAVQILLYFRRDAVFQGIPIAIGLIFLMSTAIVKTVQDFLDIEKEKQRAVSANKSKSQFLANMSHEIRTPINAVLGMDEIILREAENDDIKEYARDIQSAGRSLLSLINDILDFSKIESGKLEIIEAEYELSSLLNDSYNMVAMRAKNKNLDLRIRNYPKLPRRLRGDEVRIRQIITNMLTNAVKYTNEGSITLSLGMEELEPGRIMLKISVRDTGIGIKEEDQKILFDSFQRADITRNRNVEGTGLGLALAKQLTELMGGKIYLKSEYGKGSIFYVDIPQTVASEETLGDFSIRYINEEKDDAEADSTFRAPGGRILVVDDVAINLKVIAGLLKGTELKIDLAESGGECLEYVGKNSYDIIFLDHMMPQMDGVETFARMRAMAGNENKDTPVIMLTANAIQGAKEEYLNMGFSDYISKPVQRLQLEEMIKKYLPDNLIVDKL